MKKGRWIPLLAGLIALFVIAGIASASQASHRGNASLAGPFCVSKKTGVVRQVGLKRACHKGESRKVGFAGAAGSQGPAGAPGATGASGPQGLPGPQGDVGQQGPAGLQGAQGDQGLPGLQGDQGVPGTNGSDGADGSQGPAGTTAVYSAGGTSQTSAHIAEGTAATNVAGNGSVAFTGSAAFTSATSYVCTLTAESTGPSATNGTFIASKTSTGFTFKSTLGSTTFDYVCVGN